MKRSILPWCALSLYMLATPAFAAEATGEKRTAEPVVVTAGRIEEKARDVAKFVTIIPQEEIQKNQYQDMAGLLQNYGVQIDGYLPGRQAQVTLRGARTALPADSGAQGMVLILVDGRSIGTNNINMIPMVNIERVEIMRGPGAVQYGTSAIGGVINVITKRGTEELTASAQGGIGSWETYKGQGSLAWAYGPFDFSGGISYTSAGDYYIGGNNIHRYPNSATEGKTAYNVNVGFNFLEEHRIGVTALGTNASHMGSPSDFDHPDRKSFLDISNYSADFLYEGGYKDWGLSWKGRYFFGNDNYTMDFDHPVDMSAWGPLQYYNRAFTDFQGAQGQLSFKKNFLTLTGGLDWQYFDTTKRGDLYIYDLNYAYDTIGVFGLAKIALFDDMLILSGGVRHDVYWLETGGNRKKLEKTVPSFGVALNPTDWLTLKGNYGESYRIPNGLELLGHPGGVWGPTFPNPDLKPEEAKSWDAGLEIRHKSLQVGLSYFETEYKKKIVSVSELNMMTFLNETQFQNADGKIWLKGFEGNASYDIGEAFDWPVKVRPYVNFTALTERSRSKRDDTFHYRIPLVNDLEIGYGLNFAYPDIGFEADLRLTYIGRGYEQDWNDKSATYGQVVRSDGKTIADLFLRQKVFSSEKAGTFSVYGEIRNITNERYSPIKDYMQPGRSFFVGLRYDYN